MKDAAGEVAVDQVAGRAGRVIRVPAPNWIRTPAAAAPASGIARLSARPRPAGTTAPMTNQIPSATSAQGQYSAMISAGPWLSDPVVLRSNRMPMMVQAIGQVKAQIPDSS